MIRVKRRVTRERVKEPAANDDESQAK